MQQVFEAGIANMADAEKADQNSVKTPAKKDIKQAGIPHKNERWNSCLKFL